MNMPAVVGNTTQKYMVMQELALDVPTDRSGLPVFFYRDDLIPADVLGAETSDYDRARYLRNAAQPLCYDEGYPTLDHGDPVWHQLSWEPPEAYNAFELYLKQVDDDETPVRTLTVLSGMQDLPHPQLRAYFHLYWWKSRALAYDLFLSACETRLRQRRVARMDSNHYTHATTFIELCATYLTDEFKKLHTGEGSQLKPSDVIKLLGQAMQAQRVALGQGISGGNTEDPRNGHTSIEIIMQQLNGDRVQDTNQSRSTSGDIRKLLDDPDTLNAAQDIVIKLSSQQEGGRTRTSNHYLDQYDGAPNNNDE